jgi:hypothetical protein
MGKPSHAETQPNQLEAYNMIRREYKTSGILAEDSESFELAHRKLNSREYGAKIVAGSNGQFNIVIMKMGENKYLVFIPTRPHLLSQNFSCPANVAVSHPVHIVSSVETKVNCMPSLEEIENDSILEYPDMYSPGHKLRFADERDMSCFCPSTELSYVMVGRMSASCLSRKLFSSSGLDIELECKTYSLNSTKVFRNFSPNSSVKRLKPILPQPYLNNVLWEEKSYIPAMHNMELTKEVKYVSGLSALFYRETIAKACINEPRHQVDLRPHPQGGEPKADSELYLHCKNMYGVETLPRVHSVLHPTSYPKHISVSKMTDDLEVEIFENEEHHTVEDFILSKHSDFLSGKAKIACGLCIPEIEHGRVNVRRYSRKSYIQHFRLNHHQAILCVGLTFESGLCQRIYEGFLIYNYAVCLKTYKIDKLTAPEFDTKIEKYEGVKKALKLKMKTEKHSEPEYFTRSSDSDSDSEKIGKLRKRGRPKPKPIVMAKSKVVKERECNATNSEKLKRQDSMISDDEVDKIITTSTNQHRKNIEPAPVCSGDPVVENSNTQESSLGARKKTLKGKNKFEKNSQYKEKPIKEIERKVQRAESVCGEREEEITELRTASPMDLDQEFANILGDKSITSPVHDLQDKVIAGEDCQVLVHTYEGNLITSEIDANDLKLLDPEKIESILMDEAISQPIGQRSSSARRSGKK